METALFTLLSRLIACRTTSDRPEEIDRCFELISQELNALPFTTEDYYQNGHRSMLWRSPELPSGQKKILLNAHLDVVPASDGMFILRQEGDRLIGRGATDMKLCIASMIVALQQIYADTNALPAVDIMITSDEETGGKDGVGFLVDHIPNIAGFYELAFVPDGGDDWHIIEKTKGALQLQVTTSGRSAHGSKPWEGQSAIDALLSDLNALRSVYPELRHYTWSTTLTIGKVSGGAQVNQVSDLATAALDFRFPAAVQHDELLQQIRQLMPHSSIEVLAQGSPLLISRDNPHIKRWKALIADQNSGEIFVKETGATDGRYFAAKGIPVLLSKPVGGALHTEQEWAELPSLVIFTQKLVEFLKTT